MITKNVTKSSLRKGLANDAVEEVGEHIIHGKIKDKAKKVILGEVREGEEKAKYKCVECQAITTNPIIEPDGKHHCPRCGNRVLKVK